MTLYFIPSFLCNREVFINPRTGDVWQEGDTYKRESFGRTLQKIAQNGVDEFYVGETAKKLIGDISKAGGIITLEDLRSYEKVSKYLQGAPFHQLSESGKMWIKIIQPKSAS